jgi:hypothetical protein
VNATKFVAAAGVEGGESAVRSSARVETMNPLDGIVPLASTSEGAAEFEDGV